MTALLHLDYAVATPWYRRRRTRRVMVLAAVLTAVLVLSGYRKPLWLQAQIRYWEWQCRRYTVPADRVVFSTDPAVVAALGNDPRYVRTVRNRMPCVILAAPDCWNRWWTLVGQKFGQPGLAFVRTMENPRGESRLVAVTWGPCSRRGWVFHRDRWGDAVPKLRGTCLGTPDWLKDQKSAPTTFYAPQIDPADPTRLVVAFERGGRRGAFEICLVKEDSLQQRFDGVAVSVLTP